MILVSNKRDIILLPSAGFNMLQLHTTDTCCWSVQLPGSLLLTPSNIFVADAAYLVRLAEFGLAEAPALTLTVQHPHKFHRKSTLHYIMADSCMVVYLSSHHTHLSRPILKHALEVMGGTVLLPSPPKD